MKKELISLNRKTEISAALKRLLTRKSIQKITIQEIADECGISRYTFYHHFTDIYDCFSWMLQEEIRTVCQILSDCTSWETAFTTVARSIEHNQALLKHLQDDPRPNLLRDIFFREINPPIRLHLADLLERNQYEATEEFLSFLADHLTSTLVSTFLTMSQHEADYDESTLLEYFHAVLNGHIESILQHAEQKGFCTKKELPVPTQAAGPSRDWNHLS